MSLRRLPTLSLTVLFTFGIAYGQGAKIRKPSDSAASASPVSTSSAVALEPEGDNPRARQQWFMQGRTLVNGNSAEYLHRAFMQKRAIEEMKRLDEFTASTAAAAQSSATVRVDAVNGTGANWTQLGPISLSSDAGTNGIQDYGVVSGRVISVAVDQTDSTGNTVYIGSSGGGVWKSTNAAASDPTTVNWRALTDAQPSLISGAIAISPADHNLVIVGTGEANNSGDSYYGQGFLRSTDGGTTWTSISNATNSSGQSLGLRGIGFTAIAFSTDNPSVVVASSGAATYPLANDSSIRGLYYSTDGGQSWTVATIMDGTVQMTTPASTSQVVYDHFTQKFYAVLRYHGIYQSSDGATFTRMNVQPFSAWTLTACPTATNAGCPLVRGNLAVHPSNGTLYVIAVDGSDYSQGIAYASAAQLLSTSGTTWTSISDTGILDDTTTREITQGSYDLWISAIPISGGGTNLFVGTRDIYRCTLGTTSGGVTSCPWTNLTKVYQSCGTSSVLSPAAHVHPDQHAVDLLTSNAQIMYFTNDGGVYRTLNGAPGDGCTSANPFGNLNRNLGSLTEFVSISQHPSDPTIILGGTQDNGSPATSSTLGTHWASVNSGDGGYNEIDPHAGTDSGSSSGAAVPAGNIWYTANTGLSIQRCSNGNACTVDTFGLFQDQFAESNIGPPQVNNDNGAFYTYYSLEPQSTALLFVGTCRLWRGPGTGGGTWSYPANAISPMFDNLAAGTTQPSFCSSGNTMVSAVGAGGPTGLVTLNTLDGQQQFSVAKVIYVGMSSGGAAAGRVFVTKDSTAVNPVWQSIAQNGVPISDIAVDPRDTTGATVYTTQMSFGVPHVSKSTNFGASWTNISGNLPDAPADAIALDPNDANIIYVGTDLGVFYTTNGGTTWTTYGNGLPNIAITRMRIFGNTKLRASTYGRGVWEIPLAAPAVSTSVAGGADFGFTAVGQTSTTKALTVTNSGSATLNITGANASGDFALVSSFCSALAPGASCSANVTFSPTASGARSGAIIISSNAASSPTTVQLTGTGTTGITVSTSSLTFAAQGISTTSPSQTITVSNFGAAALTISSVVASGDFGATNDCSVPLTTGASCHIQVTFTPSAAGNRTGTLTIANNGQSGNPIVSLTGTGVSGTASASPTSLSFGYQLVSTTSAAKTVTISNTGAASLAISGISASSGFAETHDCGASLAAGSSCHVNVTFTPTANVAVSGTLIVANDGTAGNLNIPLSGTGMPAFSLPAPSSIPSQTIAAGATATYNIIIGANGGFNGMVTLNCTGAPANAGCSVSPQSIQMAGADQPVTVTFTTVKRSSTNPVHSNALTPFAALLLLPLIALRKQLRRQAWIAMVFLMMAGTFASFSACGGGGGSTSVTSPAASPGTAAGTYTLNVTATSGNVSKSTTLTVVVQ